MLVYSISHISEIRKILFWKERISVISFVAFDHITISNNGDGAVYLSHLNFSSNLETGNFSNLRHLDITLAPGSVKRINLPAQFDETELKNHYVTIGGVNDEEWTESIKQSFSKRNSCYVYNVFLLDDPGFINVQKFYSTGPKYPLRTFEANAYISLISLKNNEKIIYKFPVAGTIAVDTRSKECK